eukprot:m.11076 g.11076  ORF g.11076 m.11076 type:complete len:158 (-) comp6360_c1_seq1:98-571(-)
MFLAIRYWSLTRFFFLLALSLCFVLFCSDEGILQLDLVLELVGLRLAFGVFEPVDLLLIWRLVYFLGSCSCPTLFAAAIVIDVSRTAVERHNLVALGHRMSSSSETNSNPLYLWLVLFLNVEDVMASFSSSIFFFVHSFRSVLPLSVHFRIIRSQHE